MPHRPHDVVLVGATGFTGRQAAAWFAAHVPRDRTRWALAARTPAKLEAVRAGLGPAFADVPLLALDTLDAAACGRVAASTRVVLTTVGPYARYGNALVDACVAEGTHYVDITGETPWVRGVIDRHHARAAAGGTRIVPFCGFDSVPSDLGVWMVARHLAEAHGQTTREVRSVVRMRGGFNGGTLASALNMLAVDGAGALDDPFLLNPPDRRPGPAPERSADPKGTWRDPVLGVQAAPFFMGPVNTRVVRRSDALLAAEGGGYGTAFAYREGLRVKGVVSGAVAAGVMGVMPLLGSLGPVRALAARLGPAPGEGPTEAAMDAGWFEMAFAGEGDGGAVVQGVVRGQGDPGNRCTVRMLCESALCLAQDLESLPPRAGVLTPATAFGGVLLDRLRARGMRFEVGGQSSG